jgi:hypothetical protein
LVVASQAAEELQRPPEELQRLALGESGRMAHMDSLGVLPEEPWKMGISLRDISRIMWDLTDQQYCL